MAFGSTSTPKGKFTFIIYTNFVHFQIFACVNTLWKILKQFGIPGKYMSIINALCRDSMMGFTVKIPKGSEQ